MLCVEGVLIYHTHDVTTADEVADLEARWLEVPGLGLVKAWNLDTTRNKYTLGDVCDFF